MNKKTVFIVEDNRHQLEEIIEFISARPSLELSGFSRNGREALEFFNKNSVDLLLLDINLPGYNGVEILERLENPPYVIFITAYDEYAIRAFELGAIDYVLKPFSEERLNTAIDRFIVFSNKVDTIQKPVKKLGLPFRSNGNNYFISYDDIMYFTANGKNTIIHTEKKDFESITKLTAKLDDILKKN